MKRWTLLAAFAIAGCQGEPPDRSEEQVVANKAGPMAKDDAGPPNRSESKDARASVYTELSEANCKLIEENRDEGPYWRRRCAGPAGYSVDWTESDLRQGLEIIPKDGRGASLRLSEVVAKGAFNRLGPRIEWRGATASKSETVIVRVLVANGAEPSKPDRSLLAVARLAPSACVIAIVPPGSGQSDEARRVADASSRPCLVEG